jgi:hypothetical protein
MKKVHLICFLFFASLTSFGQPVDPGKFPPVDLGKLFQSPPESAKPWVFWYWMKAAVSRDGITADLEAMKAAGIGGAYLVPIQGVANPPLFNPPVETLTPAWWDMLRFAMTEAGRLGIQIAMHSSDGFATAGGPWITPELSMQKVVWTETYIAGGRKIDEKVPQPESYKGYFKDIALLAFPARAGIEVPANSPKPIVTTNLPNTNVQFLADTMGKESFKSTGPCWIQYAYAQPFTCRSIFILTNGNNFQAHRLRIEVSDDGEHFRSAGQLEPPRHGWFDGDEGVTHTIKPITARFFRFVHDKAGTEPASEDLENAKWNPYLRVKSIRLSSSPRINQYEGKNGQIWRIGQRTTDKLVPDSLCVPLGQIIDITDKMDASGHLIWNAPAGNWTVLRVGYTSTGHENGTAGAGKGLECDKLNPEAVKLQFDRWFDETIRQVGPDLASKVLKVFHVDSWECGSQNWTPLFREEFKKYRRYDLLKYLPAFAGIPVESAESSERFLYDVRMTIAEMVNDKFYATLASLAHERGLVFTGESVAPVMLSDGMLHYSNVDIPMGEFWVKSPSHDKPNDMFDAVSGAHVYGKPLVQAEGFTTVRMTWNEYPGMLKSLEDRNFALGINRLVQHVFVQNPWTDRKPGMTMDGVGLYFQRDQTWWKPGFAWTTYTRRCQALLQQGNYVADVAVFTGEEMPRRAMLPDRLVPTLPGIFGEEVVKSEALRLANTGVPTRTVSEGVTLTSNMAEPQNWTDPLRGYAYDAINPDALLRLAKVENGRIVLPGGASYGVLVIPGAHPMMPDGTMMSPRVSSKLLQMVKDGATVLFAEKPDHATGLLNEKESDKKVQDNIRELFSGALDKTSSSVWKLGKGKVLLGAYKEQTFAGIGIERDAFIKDSTGQQARGIAWTHRTAPGFDIYFISNQLDQPRTFELSLKVSGRVPELWDAVTGEKRIAGEWKTEKGRTVLPLRLASDASVFVIFQTPAKINKSTGRNWIDTKDIQFIQGPWTVTFDTAFGGPAKPVIFDQLIDWTTRSEPGIKYYSGTAVYSTTFDGKAFIKGQRLWIDIGKVAYIADIKVNGVSCGVAWTSPYKVEITNVVKQGLNRLTIEVTNTWANRLMVDHLLPEPERVTKTTAPFRMEGKPLYEAGLLGPVRVVGEN